LVVDKVHPKGVRNDDNYTSRSLPLGRFCDIGSERMDGVPSSGGSSRIDVATKSLRTGHVGQYLENRQAGIVEKSERRDERVMRMQVPIS
jgi:hypothetical protein